MVYCTCSFFSSSLWNLLNFFRISVCSFSVDTEFFFACVCRKHKAHTTCIYHVSSHSGYVACLLACMFAASSYITYINLSENIPLSWCIHCTWISYNNKRNEWEKRRKTAHLWIIHESLNKIFQIHFTKCVHFIVLMHLAGCYELHTRLSFFGSCCFSTSFAAFVAHAAKKLL